LYLIGLLVCLGDEGIGSRVVNNVDLAVRTDSWVLYQWPEEGVCFVGFLVLEDVGFAGVGVACEKFADSSEL